MDRSGEPHGSRAATLAPSVAILASTLFWGTLWIPLRHLNEAGLGGPWATAAGFAIPLLVLFPFGVIRRHPIIAGGWPLVQAGLLMAACIALYAEALLRGYVARVILLFYLAPVWSTLLARVFLGDRITAARIVTIALGLAGMFVVFGAGSGAPVPRVAGDWMGLVSGLLCGLSMVALQRVPQHASEFDKVFVQFLFLGLLFLLFSLVPGGRPWTLPAAQVSWRGATWLLAFGLLWMPLVLWLTMFGASRLDPGRVTVLLMLEVVIGLASASLLTQEPFGRREFVGAVFIVAACGAELLARPDGGRRTAQRLPTPASPGPR
ncbi:MAG: DMT family transporter [Deltaproteobacteria bacterium]|nr:DMT family transporter [Deltaproteobacteria bacterium]